MQARTEPAGTWAAVMPILGPRFPTTGCKMLCFQTAAWHPPWASPASPPGACQSAVTSVLGASSRDPCLLWATATRPVISQYLAPALAVGDSLEYPHPLAQMAFA